MKRYVQPLALSFTTAYADDTAPLLPSGFTTQESTIGQTVTYGDPTLAAPLMAAPKGEGLGGVWRVARP